MMLRICRTGIENKDRVSYLEAVVESPDVGVRASDKEAGSAVKTCQQDREVFEQRWSH